LTDSSTELAFYRQRYGSILLHTDSHRTAGEIGLHYLDLRGVSLGEEVVVDTYLAAQCEFFLGNARSNVSTTVQHLKAWPQDHCRLIGDNVLMERNFVLFDSQSVTADG
jgi:hypothetical protein